MLISAHLMSGCCFADLPCAKTWRDRGLCRFLHFAEKALSRAVIPTLRHLPGQNLAEPLSERARQGREPTVSRGDDFIMGHMTLSSQKLMSRRIDPDSDLWILGQGRHCREMLQRLAPSALSAANLKQMNTLK